MSRKYAGWEHTLIVEGQRMPRVSRERKQPYGKAGIDHGGIVESRPLIYADAVKRVCAEVEALTEGRTDIYWSGFSQAVEEIEYRLGLIR